LIIFKDKKAFEVIKAVQQKYSNLFKWFLLVDDDTFVFVENLKTFISKLDSNEAFTYGYNFKKVIASGYHSGGGMIRLVYVNINIIIFAKIRRYLIYKRESEKII
jgi:hypothetical protein